ncbi:related to zinc cluster transcription factor [Fusarium oxysporum]|uniref:Related to zinc cluster transcription factor n=1 Tax=Fusarium oxysporum TaxID=5507 RepID=A0A2H3TVB0_FUSOX|nr:related to zinc cluster transcription factor [Fusarium oxysporum]
MGLNRISTNPSEARKSTRSRNRNASSTNSVNPSHRASERANPSTTTIHHYNQVTHSAGMDGQHKRTRKACERCRMRKTKCDGNFPCKRCKDDGLICTATVKKKARYKKPPPAYAEALENTQLVLIATVHKLYSMVRNNEPWRVDEPELNDQGQPVVHSIAQKLNCISPRSDVDIPLHSVFPEDEASMAKLALRLREQQKQNESQKEAKDTASPCVYQKTSFGNTNVMSPSAQSFTDNSSDFTFDPALPETGDPAMFPLQLPSKPNFPPSPMTIESQPSDLSVQFLQQLDVADRTEILKQDLLESVFSSIFSSNHVPGPQIVMAMADPIIYPSYVGESICDFL